MHWREPWNRFPMAGTRSRITLRIFRQGSRRSHTHFIFVLLPTTLPACTRFSTTLSRKGGLPEPRQERWAFGVTIVLPACWPLGQIVLVQFPSATHDPRALPIWTTALGRRLRLWPIVLPYRVSSGNCLQSAWHMDIGLRQRGN